MPNLKSISSWATIVPNMSTIQLKVTLPRTLHALLKKQASKFGLTLSSYIKNLIVDDIKKDDWRAEFILTDEDIEKSYKEAKKDIKNGDIIEIKDLDEFFDSL